MKSKSSRALRRKKTNLATALANAFTMNAPGTYPVPYGATGVLVGGRGATGNAPVPGNVSQNAYYVPASYTPGNYLSGGNYAGGGYTGWYDDYFEGDVVTYYTPDNGAAPDTASGSWSGNYVPEPYSYTANTFSYYGDVYAGYSSVDYYVNYSEAGYSYYVDAWYNPTYYNPGYYQPAYTNPTYYNPSNPGNAGAPTNIGGVYLAGGAVSSAAPVVSPTMSTFKYQTSGISVTVPTGGYVVLTPIGT